jgi:hypothetical protein
MEGGENNQGESVAQPDFAFVVYQWSAFDKKRIEKERWWSWLGYTEATVHIHIQTSRS